MHKCVHCRPVHCQPINCRPVNCQPVDLSTCQPVNLSTCQPVDLPKFVKNLKPNYSMYIYTMELFNRILDLTRSNSTTGGIHVGLSLSQYHSHQLRLSLSHWPTHLHNSIRSTICIKCIMKQIFNIIHCSIA